MDAKAPGLITGGRNYSPLARAPDRKRFPAQSRIVPLLHTGVKGIKIDMNNSAMLGWGSDRYFSRTLAHALCHVENVIQHRLLPSLAPMHHWQADSRNNTPNRECSSPDAVT